jgi:glyoxylase-like metal-dependent hydrolase (beta-lactamase superfamily II)
LAGENATSLIPAAWQPLPGVPGAGLFPYIRKCDTISSNSYLIETPEVICLIDPGGLPEQLLLLSDLIEGLCHERSRPVVVLLTHAHVDHFLSLAQGTPAAARFRDAVWAVQEAGAAALERGDRFLTQADLLGLTFAPLNSVGLKLFPASAPAGSACHAENGAAITLSRNRTPDGTGLPREELLLGESLPLRVYHTPGHSPDSICLRAGRLLFIGDMLFAANPGIAGLHGWDQKALVRSLAGVRQLIDGDGIDWVLPGHGRVYAAAEAGRRLAVLEKEAGNLEHILELDAERAGQIAAYGDDCMEQVNELFTIMSGRLEYVSYVMEELGESDVAQGVTGLIQADVIDGLLEAFSAFSAEHHSADRVPLHLALKAGQVMAKLERSFIRDSLAAIIDPTLVARAGHLLSDYTTMLRGFRPPDNRSGCDLNALLSKLVTELSAARCSEEDLFSSLEDEAAFVQLLTARIGSKPLLAEVEVSTSFPAQSCPAVVDQELFSDLVVYLLEDLVGSGSGRIEIATHRQGSHAVAAISGDTGTFASSGGTLKALLVRLAARAGGELSSAVDKGSRRFEIAFDPPASL